MPSPKPIDQTFAEDIELLRSELRAELHSARRSKNHTMIRARVMRDMKLLASMVKSIQPRSDRLEKFLDQVGLASAAEAAAIIERRRDLEALSEEDKVEMCQRYLHEVYQRRPELQPLERMG